MNYALCICYDGTKFNGWQRLPGQDTIQERIENVLSKIFDSPIEISGAGRTDKGVHAKGQWASFKHTKNLAEKELQSRLNEHLPADIRVLKVKQMADTFHPRYSAVSKTYTYRMETGPILNPFEARYCYHLGQKLDMVKMERVAQLMTGQVDFAALSQAKSKKKTTIRHMLSIEFVMKGTVLEIKAKADGFLYNMMRRIATVCIEAGLGHLSEKDLLKAIETGDRSVLTYQLPPQGLYLESVDFNGESTKELKG